MSNISSEVTIDTTSNTLSNTFSTENVAGSLFGGYDPEHFYDEMFVKKGVPRDFALEFIHKIQEHTSGSVLKHQTDAELAMRQMGITFTVYGQKDGTERIMPFDMIPRIVQASEWEYLERGLKQRIHALNLFLDDIYNEQRILKENIIPSKLILNCKAYRKECIGLKPPRGIWCHITGSDIVRDSDGQYYVLEDNLRCPSGVSYLLINRRIEKQVFPQIFKGQKIRPVNDYPYKLHEMLRFLAPDNIEQPVIGVLTPGRYNSAYFEHSYLAGQMGEMLVEGQDLVSDGNYVYMRTTKGLKRVDVIYRRIDDDFIDPQVFRPDSMLGVPGLMSAYRKGNVALANATGTGIADDKAVYAYVPRIIKYYLGEEAILPIVPTSICAEHNDMQYVLENIEQMVVKAVGESGGYGMLVGPHSTKEQCDEFREKIRTDPCNYIAQPTLELSRVPTLVDGNIEGRHVDLRPYIIYGKDIHVHPGGLTRVALRKGSLVVNSSQGGGSKDTWVLAE
jgi:uncharacterized circularly permuted ATP-grasp superfamily protein